MFYNSDNLEVVPRQNIHLTHLKPILLNHRFQSFWQKLKSLKAVLSRHLRLITSQLYLIPYSKISGFHIIKFI